MLLKNCRFVITQNKEREILENVDILLENNLVKEIGKDISFKGKTIDCSNKIILPGLINTHTHVGMHSLRGICDDEELPTWLQKVVEKEKKFTSEQIEQNATHACDEMLRTGTTTFVEMYGDINSIIKATEKKQIRAVLCPVIYGLVGEASQQLDEAKELITSYNHERISLGLGAHSIYTCSQETLIAIKEFAKEHNLLTPIHIAETRKERFDIFDQTKKLPVEYLQEIGFLDNKSLLIHSIWLTKGEVRIAAINNTPISHCPVSNMKLSSGGVTPLMEMLDEGVVVGLGTDSVASNNNMDMFKEMMVAGLLHKHHRWDPKVAPVQKLLDMATIDAAKSIGMEKEIGSLETEKKADIITINISESHWPLKKQNLLSHIVYASSGWQVSDVIVDGKVALENKILL